MLVSPSDRKRKELIFSGPTVVKILQGFARCILSRKKVLRVACVQFRRIYDEESSSFYFANIKTGETFWEKPSFFLANEPAIYGEENKRSPRLNRAHSAPKTPK
jgi:hypothetical protein